MLFDGELARVGLTLFQSVGAEPLEDVAILIEQRVQVGRAVSTVEDVDALDRELELGVVLDLTDVLIVDPALAFSCSIAFS